MKMFLKFTNDVFTLWNGNNLFTLKYLNVNVTVSVRVLIYDMNTVIAFKDAAFIRGRRLFQMLSLKGGVHKKAVFFRGNTV